MNYHWHFKLEKWNNVGCRFNSKTYAKKVREKATEWYLKTAEVLLYAGEHLLT